MSKRERVCVRTKESERLLVIERVFVIKRESF